MTIPEDPMESGNLSGLDGPTGSLPDQSTKFRKKDGSSTSLENKVPQTLFGGALQLQEVIGVGGQGYASLYKLDSEKLAETVLREISIVDVQTTEGKLELKTLALLKESETPEQETDSLVEQLWLTNLFKIAEAEGITTGYQGGRPTKEQLDAINGMLIVVKTIDTQGKGQTDGLGQERLIREAKVGYQQQGIKAPLPIGLGQIPDQRLGDKTYILQQYIPDSQDLRTAYESERMTPYDAITCIEDIATAFEQMHSVGNIHRDVKSQNILQQKIKNSPRKSSWLIDFGLTRGEEHASVSRSGNITGSPQYWTPQQAFQVESPLNDIGGLAQSILHSITGRYAYEWGGNYLRAISVRQNLEEPDYWPREANPEINPRVERLLMQMMALNVLERGTQTTRTQFKSDQTSEIPTAKRTKEIAQELQRKNQITYTPPTPQELQAIQKRAQAQKETALKLEKIGISKLTDLQFSQLMDAYATMDDSAFDVEPDHEISKTREETLHKIESALEQRISYFHKKAPVQADEEATISIDTSTFIDLKDALNWIRQKEIPYEKRRRIRYGLEEEKQPEKPKTNWFKKLAAATVTIGALAAGTFGLYKLDTSRINRYEATVNAIEANIGAGNIEAAQRELDALGIELIIPEAIGKHVYTGPDPDRDKQRLQTRIQTKQKLNNIKQTIQTLETTTADSYQTLIQNTQSEIQGLNRAEIKDWFGDKTLDELTEDEQKLTGLDKDYTTAQQITNKIKDLKDDTNQYKPIQAEIQELGHLGLQQKTITELLNAALSHARSQYEKGNINGSIEKQKTARDILKRITSKELEAELSALETKISEEAGQANDTFEAQKRAIQLLSKTIAEQTTYEQTELDKKYRQLIRAYETLQDINPEHIGNAYADEINKIKNAIKGIHKLAINSIEKEQVSIEASIKEQTENIQKTTLDTTQTTYQTLDSQLKEIPSKIARMKATQDNIAGQPIPEEKHGPEYDAAKAKTTELEEQTGQLKPQYITKTMQITEEAITQLRTDISNAQTTTQLPDQTRTEQLETILKHIENITGQPPKQREELNQAKTEREEAYKTLYNQQATKQATQADQEYQALKKELILLRLDPYQENAKQKSDDLQKKIGTIIDALNTTTKDPAIETEPKTRIEQIIAQLNTEKDNHTRGTPEKPSGKDQIEQIHKDIEEAKAGNTQKQTQYTIELTNRGHFKRAKELADLVTETTDTKFTQYKTIAEYMTTDLPTEYPAVDQTLETIKAYREAIADATKIKEYTSQITGLAEKLTTYETNTVDSRQKIQDLSAQIEALKQKERTPEEETQLQEYEQQKAEQEKQVTGAYDALKSEFIKLADEAENKAKQTPRNAVQTYVAARDAYEGLKPTIIRKMPKEKIEQKLTADQQTAKQINETYQLGIEIK